MSISKTSGLTQIFLIIYQLFWCHFYFGQELHDNMNSTDKFFFLCRQMTVSLCLSKQY
jgi:hypothetical protein